MTDSSKQTLRLEAIRHRDRIDPGSEDAEDACTLFFETIQPGPEQIVALYWPKGREFDIAGNVRERGEDPSPDDRDRGERSSKEKASAESADRS